jgi:hypothetical protein
MTNEALVHTEEKDGFTIDFYACEEDLNPAGQFASGDDAADAEIISKINNGDLVWFLAKVTASKNGIVLGTDYLGGCCYESYEQFVEQNDYYADMVSQAIIEARNAIKALCAA